MTSAAEGFRIETPRLLLRRWAAGDREPFAALNADPEVMHHFPSVLDRAASDAFADRCDASFEQSAAAEAAPFGLAAVERREDGRFLGFAGLHRHRWYPDDVELGYRLARDAWGRGYATEAGAAWVAHAREAVRLPRLITIVAPGNAGSLAVAAKLGFREAWRAEREDVEHVVLVLDL